MYHTKDYIDRDTAAAITKIDHPKRAKPKPKKLINIIKESKIKTRLLIDSSSCSSVSSP